ADLQPPGRRWVDGPGTVRARLAASEIVPRGATWDDYLASRSRALRAELRRDERRFLAQGARFRDSAAEEDVEAVLRLHERRWPPDGSAFPAGPRRAFPHVAARMAHERGWLRLRLLEVDGRAIAGTLGFRRGTTEYAHLLGHDPAWARYSPGLTIIAHSI